jgi:hypothetical protein
VTDERLGGFVSIVLALAVGASAAAADLPGHPELSEARNTR